MIPTAFDIRREWVGEAGRTTRRRLVFLMYRKFGSFKCCGPRYIMHRRHQMTIAILTVSVMAKPVGHRLVSDIALQAGSRVFDWFVQLSGNPEGVGAQ